jgi:hypothetical protein
MHQFSQLARMAIGLFVLACAREGGGQGLLARLAIQPNDTRDDTSAVQRYLDEIKRPDAREHPPLPAGRLIISDTLRVNRSMGLAIRGAGGQNRSTSAGWEGARAGTILTWKGPLEKPIIELVGCTGLVIEGISFEVPSGSDVAQAILIRHGAGSLNIAIRDCGFVGGKVGIQCGTDHGELTCANITYDNCHFERQTEACVRLVNLQSLEHLFLRPQFTHSTVGIDVQAGGDVTVVGGGTYELKTFLRLGRIGSNTRGFDVQSVRFDGKSTRTQWLAVADSDRARTYGAITFRNCSQNNGQKLSEAPLLTVGPGARVVLRECSFAAGTILGGNLAHIYTDRRAGGELVVENCDGLDGGRLHEYVQAKGKRAYYTFIRCGDLYTETGSATNYPAGLGSEVAADETAKLQALAALSREDLLELLEAKSAADQNAARGGSQVETETE